MAQTTTFDTWKYRDPSLATSLTQQELLGYDVEAIDGSIGKIDDATLETDTGHIVVDTGPWIFGKKVMLPAGVLKTVDHVEREGLRESHEGRDQERPRVRRLDAERRDVPHRARYLLQHWWPRVSRLGLSLTQPSPATE